MKTDQTETTPDSTRLPEADCSADLDQDRRGLYKKVAELEEDARALLKEDKRDWAEKLYAHADGIKEALEAIR